MNRTLDVYLNAELAGSLSQNSEHEMTFTYSPNATRSISIGMPIEKKSFGASHCEAFFGGLLPEGDAARKALGRRFGTSASNSFGLLRNIGAECAGALSIVAPGQIFAAEGLEEVQLLSPAELAQHIRELPQRPLFVGVNGIRLSLSGVQDKASVSLIEGAIGLPRSGPTTHILKPDLGQAPGAIYCEHLCMKIASRIGIEVAAVNLAKATLEDNGIEYVIGGDDSEERGLTGMSPMGAMPSKFIVESHLAESAVEALQPLLHPEAITEEEAENP